MLLAYITEQVWLPHWKFGLNVLFLHEHIDPTLVHICATTQPKSTSHAIVKFIPEYGHIWRTYTPICATYEVSDTNHVTRSILYVIFKLTFSLLAYATA